MIVQISGSPSAQSAAIRSSIPLVVVAVGVQEVVFLLIGGQGRKVPIHRRVLQQRCKGSPLILQIVRHHLFESA